MRFGGHSAWISMRFPRIILWLGLEKTAGALLAALGTVVAVWMHVHHVVDPFAGLLSGGGAIFHGVDVAMDRLALHALLVAAGLGLWALLMAAEAIGIWLRKPWGELLVILETASFLPIEMWSLVHQVRIGDILTLIMNGLVLFYVANRYARRRGFGAKFKTEDGGAR